MYNIKCKTNNNPYSYTTLRRNKPQHLTWSLRESELLLGLNLIHHIGQLFIHVTLWLRLSSLDYGNENKTFLLFFPEETAEQIWLHKTAILETKAKIQWP